MACPIVSRVDNPRVSILTRPFSSALSLSYSIAKDPSLSFLKGISPVSGRAEIMIPPACVDQARYLPQMSLYLMNSGYFLAYSANNGTLFRASSIDLISAEIQLATSFPILIASSLDPPNSQERAISLQYTFGVIV